MPTKYLFLGSEQWREMVSVRMMLTGLNSWGRQWNEILTVQGNGSLFHLEDEVAQFRCLKYQEVYKLGWPNVIIAFLAQSDPIPEVSRWLDDAHDRGIPIHIHTTWIKKPQVRKRFSSAAAS